MTTEAPDRVELDPPAAVATDGDAATYLEELIVHEPGEQLLSRPDGTIIEVELVGPHLRLSGGIALGRFRRLSDVLNHHDGLLQLYDATVLRRNGTPTKVTTPAIWVSPTEVTLIGEPTESGSSDAPNDQRIAKERHPIVIITPGHALTGDVYVPMGADLSVFIESVDPPFIPMTDVRTRSLADRRIVNRYGFAVVNRRHIVAATEMPAGTARGAWRI